MAWLQGVVKRELLREISRGLSREFNLIMTK